MASCLSSFFFFFTFSYFFNCLIYKTLLLVVQALLLYMIAFHLTFTTMKLLRHVTSIINFIKLICTITSISFYLIVNLNFESMFYLILCFLWNYAIMSSNSMMKFYLIVNLNVFYLFFMFLVKLYHRVF